MLFPTSGQWYPFQHATNSTWSDIFIESTLMRYGHSKSGLTGITLNNKAVALLAHSLHSRSPLVCNLTSVQNELSKDPSSGRIQCTDPGWQLWQKEVVGKAIPVHWYIWPIWSFCHCVHHLCGTLTATCVNVNNDLQRTVDWHWSRIQQNT